jgi:uncharacterized protein (DUF2062 family)
MDKARNSRRRNTGDASQTEQSKDMTTILLSTMLLGTIVAAFVFGVAAGYWVICGVLNFFHPARTQRRATREAELVISH